MFFFLVVKFIELYCVYIDFFFNLSGIFLNVFIFEVGGVLVDNVIVLDLLGVMMFCYRF